ncbi:hypothetical protein [Pseudomarimonas salicorniae]|uniref:Uncharacterized protein n=1 Tax=Pseudomarimonas salicorniae TaxID=2933270 RepID=A0ABT0GF75_9GAMM|nr:hypothetical protein [Lysobacter sp. CAU 1642]MCK7593198.1 hypothetical protein [Lysobacter sp. CAU 1642]
MAKGLTLAEALRVMSHITASQENYDAFAANMTPVLDSLGIQSQEALNDCQKIMGGTLAPLDTLRQNHDAMVGRLLTAHLAQIIHNPTS